MCNLAAKPSEAKRQKKKKKQGDFGLTLSPGSMKRLKTKIKTKKYNCHLKNELLELTGKKYFGNKTAFLA